MYKEALSPQQEKEKIMWFTLSPPHPTVASSRRNQTKQNRAAKSKPDQNKQANKKTCLSLMLRAHCHPPGPITELTRWSNLQNKGTQNSHTAQGGGGSVTVKLKAMQIFRVQVEDTPSHSIPERWLVHQTTNETHLKSVCQFSLMKH